MTTGIEFIDLLAATLTLAFILKLVLSKEVDLFPTPSGNREKLSLLNQNITSRARWA